MHGSVVKHFPSMHKALGSNPSTPNKTKEWDIPALIVKNSYGPELVGPDGVSGARRGRGCSKREKGRGGKKMVKNTPTVGLWSPHS